MRPPAGAFAATIEAIKARRPECRVEVLIPDFQGQETPLRTVLAARPDVLNHNTETVPRLYRQARPGGRYARALELLDRARTWAPEIPTKTGLMVGLGETFQEVVDVLEDLRKITANGSQELHDAVAAKIGGAANREQERRDAQLRRIEEFRKRAQSRPARSNLR